MFEFLKRTPKPTPEDGYHRDTPLPEQKGYKQLSKEWRQRQEDFPQPEQHNVLFTLFGNPIINLMADLHIGHPTTDYKRIEDEINAIDGRKNSFVIFVGDLINNLNWNPGQMEEMEQTPHQVSFLRAILQHLAGEGKLLHHIQGDHDGWLTKSGMDIQQELPSMGVSISNGPTRFEMKTGSQSYLLSGSHSFPGHSMYNKVHPQTRFERFGAGRGSDVIFSGHNHQKGQGVDYMPDDQGNPHEVNYLALGPYKAEDSWLKKKGFAPQQYEEMGGIAVQLSRVVHDVRVFMDIVTANKQ